MKLFMCALLYLTTSCIYCSPSNYDFGERKYGIGLDLGGSYKDGAELGVRAQDGTYSVFANKNEQARANVGLGVYKSVKPYQPNTQPPLYTPYPVQYDPRYPVPMYLYPVIPRNPPYDPRMYVPVSVPVNVPYPQIQPLNRNKPVSRSNYDAAPKFDQEQTFEKHTNY